MTVIIKTKQNPQTFIASEMQEGKAYKDSDGTIYICINTTEFAAFSVCGKYVVYKDCTIEFTPCTIEITEV